ncbi:MAG: tetratricopeptide repeat protein [Acidobacteriota bacterium]
MKKVPRKVLLSVFVVLLSATAAYGDQIDWVQSLDEAVTLASNQHKFIVVDVCADWSSACRELSEKVYTDPQFVEFSKSQVFTRIDAGDIVGEWMAGRFKVRAYPTILVLDSQGREIDRLRGSLSAAELRKFLQMVFDTPLSIKELNERADAKPDDLRLQTAAGRRAVGRGDFKEAQHFLTRAVELTDPKDSAAMSRLLSDLAQAGFGNHDYREAVHALDRLYAVDDSARQIESLKLVRARSLIELDRDQEAYDLIVPDLDSPEEWVRWEARDVFKDLPKELRKGIEEREKLEKEVTEDLKKGRFEQAKRGAEELVSKKPNDGLVHVQLAEALFGLQPEAPPHGEAGPTLERAYAELRLGRRLSLDDEDTYETASRLTVALHGVRSEPDDRGVRKEFEKAEKDFARRKYDRAAKRYRKVLDADPTFGKALRRLGDCLLFHGQIQDALETYLRATKVNPNDAAAFRLAADAYGQLNQPEHTWEMYRQSLLADPDYPETWLDLETWGKTSGEGFERHASVVPVRLLIPGSRDEVKSVLTSLPAKTRPAWTAYANCKMEGRERRLKEGSHRLADAKEERTCLGRAVQAWDELKSEDRSVKDDNLDFLRQVSIDGQLDSFVFLELFTEQYRPAFEAWKAQNHDRALLYLNDYVFGQAQAAAREGYNSSALKAFNEGAAIHDSDPAGALEFYRKALRQEPYMLPALENACDLDFRQERYDDALGYLRRWREVQPESSRALYLLGFVFIQHQEYSEALPLLQKAAELEKDPNEQAKIEENIRYCQDKLSE